MPPLAEKMRTHLTKRNANSAFRSLTTAPPTSIDFSSNDFLSLSTSSLFKAAYLQELSSSPNFRLGSGGSRLLDGNSPYYESLEKEIADFHGAEAALLFNSGFDANSGFFACVPQDGDIVVYDEAIHASVHEGMKLSRASTRLSFKHNAVSSLKKILEALCQRDDDIKEGKRNIFIAIESLYSMDGDLAPIRQIVDVVESVLKEGNGYVVVDEAHSNGIYGPEGRGIVSSLGLEGRVFTRLHTFGKGLGCNGAAILCDALTREYLINYARPLIYSTAMSFPSLAAIKVAYSLMRRGVTEPLITHLDALIGHLYDQLTTLVPHTRSQNSSSELIQIPIQAPQSPIFALLTPEPRSLAKYCQERGFVVRPIVPPTVPEGTQRVRVCLHAGNTFQDVERLVATIQDWLNNMRKVDGEGALNLGFVKATL